MSHKREFEHKNKLFTEKLKELPGVMNKLMAKFANDPDKEKLRSAADEVNDAIEKLKTIKTHSSTNPNATR